MGSAIHITYFVHGTTGDNQQGLASGWADAPLSPLGVAQAKELGHLAAAKNFDAVFTSDLRRAVDTAAYAFEHCTRTADRRLRECDYGQMTRQPNQTVDAAAEAHIDTPFPDGESYRDVEKRIRAFLDDLRPRYAGRSIAIVSHKAPQLALDVLIGGLTWEQAFANDWRKKGGSGWKPGWPYVFQNPVDAAKNPNKTSDCI